MRWSVFSDAVQSEHQSPTRHGWFPRKAQKIALNSHIGTQALNFKGALDLETFQFTLSEKRERSMPRQPMPDVGKIGKPRTQPIENGNSRLPRAMHATINAKILASHGWRDQKATGKVTFFLPP